METLRDAAEKAREGHGQIVAVMAEPGVGKSRLFYEFKAIEGVGPAFQPVKESLGRLSHKWMVLEAFSVSHGKASAYLPALELLSEYFEISRDDDDRKRGERILGKVLRLDRNLEDSLPYLYSLYGIGEVGDSLAEMDPRIRRHRTLDAINRILVRESQNQPLMLIFEDLHWIDAETQALLNLLVDAIANSRIVLLVNYRPEYQHEWGNRTHYAQLILDPLGRESADKMLSALLGDEPELTLLKRLIVERTAGTPFFIEEMVQALFDEGALERNGAIRLTRPLGTVKVPPTVQAVLASRIDRLAPAEKELLQTLAVLGMKFSLTLVQRMTAKSGDELEQILAQLQFGEFIYEQPAVSGVEYAFVHALTQEVAYNAVLMERRKALHERAGQAIEDLFADRLDDFVADLVRHYERSGNGHKAIQYLGRAGKRAAQQAAHSEVVGYVTRALELVNRIPNSTDQAYHELDLQLTLGGSLAAAAPASLEREKALTRALELCEHLGDDRITEAMLSLGFLQATRGEPAVALQLFEKALALAEQAKDADVIAAARGGMCLQLMTLGQFEKAYERIEDASEFFGSRPIRSFGPASTLAQTRESLLGLTLLLLGHPTTALKRSKIALDTVRRPSEPMINAVALAVYVLTYLAFGDLRAVAEQIEELVGITAEHEMPVAHAFATFYRAWLKADAGQVNEGLAEMRWSIKQLGVYPLARMLVAALAEVCCRNGLPDEGLETISQALARSDKTPWLHAEFHRLKGELTLLSDSHNEGEAERHLRQAIEVAQRQAARLFELRATTSLARLLRDTNRRDEARTMLADIYNWFTEGFELPDLRDAKALLDELSR
jgi:tetratricopeptide (TPR) repeat protein